MRLETKSNGSDPGVVLEALTRAQDAFQEFETGVPDYEGGIAEGGDWETLLTKACKLPDVVIVLRVENDYYTALIELCFGAMERSIEADLVAMAGNEVEDFEDHEYCYDRADQAGLFEPGTAEAMKSLSRENRTESYYGGGRPTAPQAEAMTDLSRGVFFLVDPS